MSLTGYERELAAELAFTPDDARLDNLRKLAADKNIIIAAGAPIKQNYTLYIGSFILYPNGSVAIYTKQYLHAGEELFFEPGTATNTLIELEKERISLAICADLCNPLHAADAGKLNATIYLASLFYTPNGIPEANTLLSRYAKDYNMGVLMANFGGPSYNFQSGGQSGFWNTNGELVTKLADKGEGLLLVNHCEGV
jgi:predicted amidohydrolase